MELKILFAPIYFLLYITKFLTKDITDIILKTIWHERKLSAKKIEPNQPVNIGDRAFDNLKFIRETMEARPFSRAFRFTADFDGRNGDRRRYIAHSQASIRDWLAVG